MLCTSGNAVANGEVQQPQIIGIHFAFIIRHHQLGIAWMLTGEKVYFMLVRDILMQYARYYPAMPSTGGYPITAPGK